MRLGEAFLIAAVLGQDPVFQLRVDVPLVSVDVKVLDSRGQPMTSLTAKDFIIAEDGVEQQVASFTSIDTPYNILLLFDRSGSTEELWTTMQRSADRFVRNLRSQDHVALAAFDEGVMMLSGWNDSRDEARRALDELSERGPGGGTNLYQSLERVTQREFYNTSGRRAVVVLTDGRDTALLYQRQRGNGLSDPVFQRTANIVRASRVPVYFVALNTDKNRNGGAGGSETLIREARARMELVAGVSGGGFFSQEVRERLSMFTIRSAGISAVPTASPTLQPTLSFRAKLTGSKFAFTAPALSSPVASMSRGEEAD